jgi:hypothetical protein
MLPMQNPVYIIGLVIVVVIAYFFVTIPLKKADATK